MKEAEIEAHREEARLKDEQIVKGEEKTRHLEAEVQRVQEEVHVHRARVEEEVRAVVVQKEEEVVLLQEQVRFVNEGWEQEKI